MSFNDSPADVETQACTAASALHFVDPEEFGKQPGDCTFGYTFTVIFDRYLDAAGQVDWMV
jgi:hypothetical protein